MCIIVVNIVFFLFKWIFFNTMWKGIKFYARNQDFKTFCFSCFFAVLVMVLTKSESFFSDPLNWETRPDTRAKTVRRALLVHRHIPSSIRPIPSSIRPIPSSIRTIPSSIRPIRRITSSFRPILSSIRLNRSWFFLVDAMTSVINDERNELSIDFKHFQRFFIRAWPTDRRMDGQSLL